MSMKRKGVIRFIFEFESYKNSKLVRELSSVVWYYQTYALTGHFTGLTCITCYELSNPSDVTNKKIVEFSIAVFG